MKNLVNDINKVYDMLEDDLSRKVYNARLDYILNKKYDEFAECLEGEAYEIYELSNKQNLFSSYFKIDEIVIIYGAGAMGVRNYQAMKRLNPTVKCIFCDSNYSKINKTDIFEQDIISPKDLLLYYSNCKVIISVGYKDTFLEILNFLKENNIKEIFSGSIFYSPQYFDEVIKLDEKEIFVDVGVLDGGTSMEFSKQCNNIYKKIYLFEADKNFKERIQNNISHLKNTELTMCGLWNKKDILTFVSGTTGSSFISENGLTKLDVDTLDNMLQGQEVTFIKMDIEGAELNALIGSKETIKQYKPKLAICVYHKNEDILSIPLYIKELVPEYKFYMRHYSSYNTETVLYAIVD